MPYYKFCRAEHATLNQQGSLRCSSLAYFRYLEFKSCRSGIGDRNEGKATTHGRSFIVETAPKPDQIEELAAFGISVTGDVSGSEFSSNTLVGECSHALIFSYSEGKLDDLWPGMAREGYNACVEVLSPDELVSALRESTVDGVPFHESFIEAVERRVEYQAVAQFYTPSEGVLKASPFRKEAKFAFQCERRVVMSPRDPRHKDIVTVKLSRPNAVFGKVHKSPLEVSPAPRLPPEMTREELLARVLTISDNLNLTRSRNSLAWLASFPLPDKTVKLISSFSPAVEECYWQARLLGARPANDGSLCAVGSKASTVLELQKKLWAFANALGAEIDLRDWYLRRFHRHFAG